MPPEVTPSTIAGQPAPIAFRPTSDQVIEFLKAQGVMGETTRYRQLDRMEAFFRGLQYSHQRVDFWGRDPEVAESISANAVMPPGFVPTGPGTVDGMTVRDCRPTAPKGLCKTIVKRYTGLLLAEKRKPKIVVDQDQVTDAFLEAVRESGKFWQAMRAARDYAGAEGSVCVTVHLREGEFSYDVHNPKHVAAIVWKNQRKWQPSGILLVERFETEEDVLQDGKPAVASVQWLNRRIITENEDIVYVPARLDDSLEDKPWEVDEPRSTRHGLGYFPGVWIQNHSDNDLDGDPDCDQAWQTIDTIDRLIAQMNKGTLLNLDPTTVLKYDDKAITAQGGVRKGSDTALHVGAEGDAKYMEMAGSGTVAGIALLGELMKTVRDLTGYVPIDPDKISGAAQSAKAIEYILEPMIERADDLRAQFGPAIIDLQKITEKMARAFSSKTIPLADGRRGRFVFLGLQPRKMQVDGVETLVAQTLGPGGNITLIWPRYFQPTADDERKEIDNAVAANAGGFVSKATAARKAVAELYGVKDVDGEVAAAKDEAEQDALSLIGGGGFGGGNYGGGGDNVDLTETDDKLQTKIEQKVAAAAAAQVV